MKIIKDDKEDDNINNKNNDDDENNNDENNNDENNNDENNNDDENNDNENNDDYINNENNNKLNNDNNNKLNNDNNKLNNDNNNNNNNNLLLGNVFNYNKNLTETITDIQKKYILIIKEFIKNSIENIFISNQSYKNYIIIKGIETISNVFKILFLYTNNLNVVYFNCQRAILYYIQFIEQIVEEKYTYLQLTSRDASIFVYKKTIYEIPDKIKETQDLNIYKEENEILNKLIIIYKICITNIFKKDKDYNSINIAEIENSILKIINSFSNLSKNNYLKVLEILELFIENFNINLTKEKLQILIKKFKKNEFLNLVDLKSIKRKFYFNKFNIDIKSNSNKNNLDLDLDFNIDINFSKFLNYLLD